MLKYIILFLIALNVNALHIDDKLEDQKLEKEAHIIFKNVKCITCPSQSIDDSDTNIAVDMRKFIRNELKTGKTRTEIENNLRNRFGDEIILTPKFNEQNYILWILPLISIIIAIYILIKKI